MLHTTFTSAKRVGFPLLSTLIPPSNRPLGCPGLKGLSRITDASPTIARVSPGRALDIFVSLLAEQLVMLRHAMSMPASIFPVRSLRFMIEPWFRRFWTLPVTSLCVDILLFGVLVST